MWVEKIALLSEVLSGKQETWKKYLIRLSNIKKSFDVSLFIFKYLPA